MKIAGACGVDYEKHGRAKNEISIYIIFFFHEYHVKCKAVLLNFAGISDGMQVLPAPLGWYFLGRLS